MKRDSKDHLAEFVARGDDDIQRIVAVLGLGMCRAISAGALSAEYACHRLFGPAVMSRVRSAGGTLEFLEVLNKASQLEDIEEHAPKAFAGAVAKVEAGLMDHLRTIAPTAVEGEKWIVVHDDST